jgi:hypothetical protein
VRCLRAASGLLAAKQVTTDFTAGGELARVVNQMVPFFNAAIQGPRANIRAALHHPQRFAWRGLQLTALTLLLWWRYRDEEWYTQMPYRERWLHWYFPFDWNGVPQLARLPRAFEVGLIFSALPEMLLDAWYRDEPAQARAYVETFFDVVAPDVLPVPFRVAAEQLAYREFFYDRPIETMAEQRKPPEERFNEYTSRAAIVLGDLFDQSPQRIDHALRGMLGPVGGDLLSVLGLGPADLERERELADLPVIGRVFQRGGAVGIRDRSIDELYEALELAQRQQASDRNLETVDEQQLRLQLNDAAQAISALLYVRRATPSVAARGALSREASAIARDALAAHRAGELKRPQFAAARKLAEGRKTTLDRERVPVGAGR